MKKINFIMIILFSIFIFYSLINIKETNASTMNVLITFSKTILPALLPFLILNQLIIKLGIIDLLAYFIQYISYPLFKISGKGASVILIGVLNGFPSSAIFTSLLLKDKQITKKEAQRLINAIFFPSISFIFVIISSYLNNQLVKFLSLSIYLSGFIILYLSSFKENNETTLISFSETKAIIKNKLTKFLLIKDLKEAITYSFTTLLNILGILVIFSIPCNIITHLTQSQYSYFIQGLLEFSISSIKLLNCSLPIKSITLLLSIVLSFSGLSSILQASIFISEVNLSTKQFIINRLLASILSFTILFLLFSLL